VSKIGNVTEKFKSYIFKNLLEILELKNEMNEKENEIENISRINNAEKRISEVKDIWKYIARGRKEKKFKGIKYGL
jgi:methionine salvage enolase-phosphatase E1